MQLGFFRSLLKGRMISQGKTGILYSQNIRTTIPSRTGLCGVPEKQSSILLKEGNP
jgi:hypothetical protein